MKHIEHVLPNGLRIVFHPSESQVGHCAILLNTGSRQERENEQGMAHFIEHNLFKGTKKRKTYHILSRLDDVGGELNAYTTKEETVIHASFLRTDFNRALELVADILINSTFPVKELNKEKDVIRDEIHSYIDSPSEHIFDEFENQIFAGHAMGHSILGTEESLDTFNRKMVLDFIHRNFHPEKMVLSVSGKIGWSRLFKMVEKYFSEINYNGTKNHVEPISAYHPKTVEEQKETYQTHAIIGNRAYDYNHPDFTAMVLLNNLLGGPGMNNRLSLNIREKYGFAYNIESFYSPYSDTGIFGIYLGTHKGTIKRSIELVLKELKKLRNQNLGSVQLSKAKKQLIGQIALNQENNLALTLALGKSFLNYNRIDTLEDVYKKIESVTATQIRDISNHIFNPNQLSQLIYKAR